MESIHVKAKNWSNIFVESVEDDDGKQEVFLSVHIVGSHCSTRMTREQAVNLVEALQAVLAQNEQVV
jgi:hypothetical protein